MSQTSESGSQQHAAAGGAVRQESQLIGSILEQDADDGADLVRRPFFSSNAAASASIARSMSAPPSVEVCFCLYFLSACPPPHLRIC